ncbi:hypothetical protein BH09ACT12_BH09ACT12_24830 [soil metagenome]
MGTVSEEVQRFSVSSARVFGVLAVATGVGMIVLILAQSGSDPSYLAIALIVFFGALAWAALLRPRLELDASQLVIRNMLSTDTLPLGAIESVAVRQVLVVVAGGKRYASPAVGRTRRQLHKDGRQSTGGGSHGGMMGFVPSFPSSPEQPETAKTSYGLFVEERIRSRVADALAQQGIKPRSAEQARLAEGITRQPAFAEIAVLAVSLAASVVLLFL